LGSTLIEYESVPWEELNKLCAASARKFLAKRGYPVVEPAEFHTAFEQAKETYRKAAAETLVEWDVPKVAREYLAKCNVLCDEELLAAFFNAYYEPVEKNLFIYQDTIETLEKLKVRFPKMGLVSNTVFPERAHLGELKRFGIKPFLDFTIFSSSFGLRKPHPDIFYRAANLAGYAPAECVYVGDRYVEDIVGPTSIGMPAILRVKPDRAYPVDMPADTRRVNTLSELGTHIEI
jgi:HAD superfamily hydrolase (TIGR01549 family)